MYYCIMSGNVKDITAFITRVSKFAGTLATAIGGKGFYSKKNVEMLEKRKVRFFIWLPSRRSGIDYSTFNNHSSDEHFCYTVKLIKFSPQSIDGRWVYIP